MENLAHKRIFVFALVGVSGVVVNQSVFALALSAGLHYSLASPLAIEIAIINNYIWNDRFTWAGQRAGRRFGRVFLKFNAVSWLAGGVNYLGLLALVAFLGMDALVANLVAIALASVLNYIFNDRWTFRR